MPGQLTEPAFHAALREMKLRPSENSSRVYLDEEHMAHNVKDPTTMTSEQRFEYIALKRHLLGMGPKPDFKPSALHETPVSSPPDRPERPPMT